VQSFLFLRSHPDPPFCHSEERSDEESDRVAVILSEAKDLLRSGKRSFVALLLRMTGAALGMTKGAFALLLALSLPAYAASARDVDAAAVASRTAADSVAVLIELTEPPVAR
jgi:hypothetical protein